MDANDYDRGCICLLALGAVVFLGVKLPQALIVLAILGAVVWVYQAGSGK